MKKCPKCKADIQEEARFCLYCMTSFEEKQTIETPKENNKRWLIIIAAVLALVLIVACIFLFNQKDSQANGENDTSSTPSISSDLDTSDGNTTTSEQQNSDSQGNETSVPTGSDQTQTPSKNEGSTTNNSSGNTTTNNSSTSGNSQNSTTNNTTNSTSTNSTSSSNKTESSNTSSSTSTTTTPSQKRITEEEFVAHITKKLAQSDFKKSSLNKAEIHNLSLLLKTSVDQILNMDKKEYRRLANIYHVDGTNFCGKDYFSIVDTLYKAQ